MSEIQARIDAYERKVNEQIFNTDAAFKVTSFVKKLLG
jgi:hypothetical protein